jgi:hypothetical protein
MEHFISKVTFSQGIQQILHSLRKGERVLTECMLRDLVTSIWGERNWSSSSSAIGNGFNISIGVRDDGSSSIWGGAADF